MNFIYYLDKLITIQKALILFIKENKKINFNLTENSKKKEFCISRQKIKTLV
jgi:hypothetical protein